MSMPARPGAITGPSMATCVLIRYFCSNLSPQSAAATAPLISPLLVHLVRLVHGVDPPSPSLSHFRECLEGALEDVPAALKAPLFGVFDGWWAAIKPTHKCLQQIFLQLEGCMQPPDEPEDTSLRKVRFVDRRSTFGVFLRRAWITFDKAEMHQQTLWAKNLCDWRDAAEGFDGQAGSSYLAAVPYPLGQISGQGTNAPSTLTRMQAFDRYQSALHRGDYSAAKEHMFTFFDHTARGATREMHQHALLNLAALHLEMDSPAAAEPALHEAILLARSSKDWECVSACESLLKRVQATLVNEQGQEVGEPVDDAQSAAAFSTSTERDKQFAALFAQTSKAARRGEYETALSQLLSSPLLSTLSMREHSTWQAQIWKVLWTRARRRGENGAMQRIRAMCRDVTIDDWVYAWESNSSGPSGKGKGRDTLRYMVLKTADQLLHEYGQRTHARVLLDSVMPEILEDDDLEVRGIVQWLYAQSLLTEEPSPDRVREACSWIRQALEDFRATECVHRQGSALYHLARWHDVLGDITQRDAFARQLIEVEEAISSNAGPSGELEQLLDEVVEVVSLLGANVAVGIPV
ncbi:hypothetical protein CF319_g2736 [Tilletia indica]|nr:hypothetical protein CF319_g2736 [Tilletia indica]